MERKITLPLTEELAKTLHSGDRVLVTGTIYTSRDAGHKRMCEALAKGEKIPFDPKDATIYYVGPTPAKPGQVIGSAGPTTSGRMDAYAPAMMSVGARGMIGKGARLPEVIDAMKKYHGVYFGAIGGAGALLAKCIKKAELIKDFGINGDAHAGKWHRQVSLLSYETIEEFKSRGADVIDGAFGENLVVKGIDLKNINIGDKLKCNNVILEITQKGKECHSHCEIYTKMGECIMPTNGVFAVVNNGGIIEEGDEINVYSSGCNTK